MSITVEATYEDGVLKPAAALPLKQHDKVRLTVEEILAPQGGRAMNLADWFSAIEAETGLVDGPTDWAAQHDHYLCGAPKRTANHGS